ncbi:uncharacterized protein [Ptychodera flava]|uniref:uncharacterized protein n=1 Tax=Ptychodera flava TaxID=63121 RepID=UPI00396A5FD4
MASVVRGIVYSLVAATLSAYIFRWCVFEAPLTVTTLVYWLVSAGAAVVCVTYGYLAYKFLDERTSPYHTYTSAFIHAVIVVLNDVFGRDFLTKHEMQTMKARETQEELLLHILTYNSDTEHGQKFDFQNIKSREEFRKKHPLTKYESYRKNIERVAKGESNLLTRNKTIHLALTSGTTGGESMFPVSQKYFAEYFKPWLIATSEIYRQIPESKSLQKILWMKFGFKARHSDAGIPIGPASASYKRAGWVTKLLQMCETSPPHVTEILSEPETLYILCVFGLRDRTVGTLNANFTQSIYTLFMTMETKWKQIVADVERGNLDPELVIRSDIREKLNASLQPDPVRARELRREFSKGFRGIAKRVWPFLNYISAINTGSMKPYGQRLHDYYAPGVPIVSYMYSSSEGVIGVNMWPLEKQSYYSLLLGSNFYEFIPAEKCDGVQPPTRFIEELEIGQEYEIVLTNEHGLYRYRLGDVLKVVRYHNGCPVVEFMYRRGQLLNVQGEKTSEVAVYSALQDALAGWKSLKLVDYTCAESIMIDSLTPGGKYQVSHYVIFLELEHEDGADVQLSEEQLTTFDWNLRERSLGYNVLRSKNTMAPTTIHIMKPGSFVQLRHFMISNTSASSTQYKVPRVLKRREAVVFMLERVVRTQKKSK